MQRGKACQIYFLKFVVAEFEPFDHIEILLISLTKGISSLIIDVDKRLIGRNGMYMSSLVLLASKAFHSFSFFDFFKFFIPHRTILRNSLYFDLLYFYFRTLTKKNTEILLE